MASWGKWVLVGLALLAVLVCCCIVVIVIAGGVAIFSVAESSISLQPTPVMVEIHRDPICQAAMETHITLLEATVPENDLIDLAERLEGKTNIPLMAESPHAYQVGDIDTFWVSETNTNQNFQVAARLAYITDHAYFWVQEEVKITLDDLHSLADAFEESIYPQTRAVFGSESSPGIDNDARLYILYAEGLGGNIAGYFSSRDAVHPLAHEYSNGHDMFIFNADTVNLDQAFTYGVLAHEFQHMIQWNVDRNESTWLNEGLSELASFLLGYDPGGFDRLFLWQPDMQLNDWPEGHLSSGASYGSAFLFTAYYHDRFGEEMTKDLVAHPANGLESVDAVLAEWGIKEGQTEEELGADDVFQNWVVANYLGDTGLEDGRYGYHSYVSAPRASETEWLSECDGGWQERSVYQYGTDYIRISCAGSYQLEVEGSHEVGVVPENAHSGEMMWWTNRGDESDMTLTRQFDLSEVSGEAELRYWVWYDLEEDYDYVYVEASENGEDWEILRTPGGTEEDPSGNSYGWGYNGLSGGWVEESVDLSSYAGSLVWVRFEYVTDAAVNGEGMLLDDMRLEALGYAEDFEDGAGEWEGEGFVRIANRLPQAYGMSLIWMRETGVEVERVEMGADQRYEREVELGGDVNELIIVISGMTRYTNQPAGYRFRMWQ